MSKSKAKRGTRVPSGALLGPTIDERSVVAHKQIRYAISAAATTRMALIDSLYKAQDGANVLANDPRLKDCDELDVIHRRIRHAIEYINMAEVGAISVEIERKLESVWQKLS